MDDNDDDAETEEDKITRNDIKNMTYVAVRQGFIFQCLVNNCWFQTMKKFSFINHLEENHKETEWDGYCNKCSMEVSKKVLSREDEFWHMMERHVHKENSKPDSLPDVVEIPVDMIKNPVAKKTASGSMKKSPEKKPPSPSKPLKKLTLQLTQEIGSIISSQLLASFKPLQNDEKESSPPMQKLKKVSLIKIAPKEVPVSPLKKLEVKRCEDPPKKAAVSLIGKKVSLDKLTNLKKIAPPPTVTHAKLPPQTKPVEKPVEENEDKIHADPISNVVNLRPWLSRPAKKFLNRAVKLLAPNSLISTFKCMGPKCEFHTSNAVNFKTHLEEHISAAPGNIANYLICPYCDANFTTSFFNKTNITDLIKHVVEAHCYDNYQCKYCYYRSCANFNVLTHQRLHHRMQQHVIIKINNTKKRDYKAEIVGIKEKCKKNIRPLMCASK